MISVFKASRLGRVYLISAIISAVFLATGCGDKRVASVAEQPESFQFFDIGANTVLDDGLQDALRVRLGREAVETRNPIDLETQYEGFLGEHFKTLQALDKRLNPSEGGRSEHPSVKLRYRYMDPEAVAFDYVELIFCGYTRRPLVFRIHSKQPASEMKSVFVEKYGEPSVVPWGRKNQHTWWWSKHGDILMLSAKANQFDALETEIMIYFVRNLEFLLDREMRGSAAADAQKRIKNAF